MVQLPGGQLVGQLGGQLGVQRSVDLNLEWHPTVLRGVKCYTCENRPFPFQGQVGHSEHPEIPSMIRLPISPPGSGVCDLKKINL